MMVTDKRDKQNIPTKFHKKNFALIFNIDNSNNNQTFDKKICEI